MRGNYKHLRRTSSENILLVSNYFTEELRYKQTEYFIFVIVYYCSFYYNDKNLK